MKKISLIFVIYFLPNILFAQPFYGLPTSNAEWILSILKGANTYIGDTKTFVNGDTTINGTLYHKFYSMVHYIINFIKTHQA